MLHTIGMDHDKTWWVGRQYNEMFDGRTIVQTDIMFKSMSFSGALRLCGALNGGPEITDEMSLKTFPMCAA